MRNRHHISNTNHNADPHAGHTEVKMGAVCVCVYGAITFTNTGILSNRPLAINFMEMGLEYQLQNVSHFVSNSMY